MARRKSRVNRPVKKAAPKLDTIFTCPFCNHAKSVGCFFDKKEMTGTVECSICMAKYGTKITYLTEPIDVYSEWIDECERVNS
ncbi:hypothetical protein Tsubulata_010034 [Turnera subulata]|uniref:Transcription elongation factor 1 homolog n=1 Tax=Turnera subulata TaxID=218843 RepID=A0A9Q0JGJ7_9ROSI|nr:hypothetical protein Tsubulata_010034 [Turnera subulata]